MRRFITFIYFLLSVNSLLCQGLSNSLHFDGVDDWVDLNSLSNTLSGSTNFSVEFWMKADLNNQTSSIRTSLFSINDLTVNGNRFLIILGGTNAQTGNIMIYDQGSWGTNSDFISAQVVGDNVCHHIAYTRNGLVGSIYIDGILAGTHVPDFNLAPTDLYSIGQEWDFTSTANPSTSQFYNGYLRDIRIWGDTRTASEINQNMYATLTGTEPGLLALYHANDGFIGTNNAANSTLVDASPNVFNGQLNAFALNGCVSNWANIDCDFITDVDSVDICLGSNAVLSPSDTSTNYSYTWFKQGQFAGNGQNLNIVNADNTDVGNYSCEITIGNCLYKTVHFYVQVFSSSSAAINLGNDTILCPGEILTLFSSPLTNPIWQDGSANSQYNVDQPGLYWVESTNSCITGADSIIVDFFSTEPIIIDLQNSCEGEVVQFSFNGGISNQEYTDPVWGFGNGNFSNQSNATEIFQSAGDYSVLLTVTDTNGCSVTATETITIYDKPDAQFFISSGLLKTNSELHFTNNSSNSSYWEWNFGDGNSFVGFNAIHQYSEPGLYTAELIAINNYCSDTISMVLDIARELVFYVPNAFTLDGFNPIFQPVFTSGFDPYQFHMVIFNRWGEIIFESFDASKGWDGTYNGSEIQTSGVFVWQIEFGEKGSDQNHLYRGHVTLVK